VRIGHDSVTIGASESGSPDQPGTGRIITRVLIAVDDTEESIRAAVMAQQLFGDAAEYLAVNVVDVGSLAREPTWWGDAWGTTCPVAYGRCGRCGRRRRGGNSAVT
jgi:hypothetical protein